MDLPSKATKLHVATCELYTPGLDVNKLLLLRHDCYVIFRCFFSISRIICDRSMGFVSIDAEWSISYLSLIHYLVISAREK